MPDIKEIQEDMTKQRYRKQMWHHIKKNEVASFPSSVQKIIPNFKGAADAAKRLAELDVFKQAKLIKINPDKPQEPVRLLALQADKDIIVPFPKLKSGPFLFISPSSVANKDDLKNIITRHGIMDVGKLQGFDSNIKVDLVVFGAVCVSPSGYRIGKGEGFADLEYAVLRKMEAIDENTIVVTTVHDCQIVDDLPSSLFKKFDVPVDIIVTPTRTIVVKDKLNKPSDIFWDLLTEKRVESMPGLQGLLEEKRKKGEIVWLKKEDSNDERPRHKRSWVKRIKSQKRPKVKREDADTDAPNTGDGETKEEVKERDGRRGRVPRKLRPRERKGDGKRKTDDDREPSANENTVQARKDQSQASRRHKTFKPRSKAPIDFSLKLSNIKSDVRVRDLKNALLERGVKPSDITWLGHRGFCYLHFGKLRSKDTEPDQPVQVDSIVANLQQLRLGEATTNDTDEYVIVEPAKPITRIEITDVTAV